MTAPSAPTHKKKRGTVPAPRYQLTREFVRAARKRPLWMLASWAGFNDITELSRMLFAGMVTGTPLMIERMQRIADAIDFPREHVFVQQPEGQ